MIGVLSQDDDLYLLEGRLSKGIEDKTSWRIALSATVFLTYESR